jgi:hypothetical protein
MMILLMKIMKNTNEIYGQQDFTFDNQYVKILIKGINLFYTNDEFEIWCSSSC